MQRITKNLFRSPFNAKSFIGRSVSQVSQRITPSPVSFVRSSPVPVIRSLANHLGKGKVNPIMGNMGLHSRLNFSFVRFFSAENEIQTQNEPMTDSKNGEIQLETTRAHNIEKLFEALSDLNQTWGINLKDFPIVCVIGPQSSGKTSVIEALIGVDLFPKDMKMSTKVPFIIATIRSPIKKYKVGDKMFEMKNDAMNEIDRLNNNTGVTQIHVTIWGPDVYNAYFTDLPGLFVVADEGSSDLPKKFKRLTEEYLNNPNTIPFLVHSAPTDPATNQALRLLYNTKRVSDAFVVITKADMMKTSADSEYLRAMLMGAQQASADGKAPKGTYPFKHGGCAVALRSTSEVAKGVTIAQKIESENELFKELNLYPSGVMTLRKMTSEIQFSLIKANIPEVLKNIDAEIDNLRKNQKFTLRLLEGETVRLVDDVHDMIDKLVGSSPDRTDMEVSLRDKMAKELYQFLSKSFKNNDDVRRIPGESDKNVDGYVYAYNKNTNVPIKNFAHDHFKDMFSYGLSAPVLVDNILLEKMMVEAVSLGNCVGMIDPKIDDIVGRKRQQWNRYLNEYFTALLKDDSLVELVKRTTENLLMEYIIGTNVKSTDSDDFKKRFAEYSIKKISEEAYAGDIKTSIRAVIGLERRPSISIYEVTRHLTQMYPTFFNTANHKNAFFVEYKNKMVLEIYSQMWNEAYVKAVCEKIIDNCYRGVAIYLLDPMIKKLILYCIDMRNEAFLKKEKLRLVDAEAKLMETRKIIQSFAY